MNFLWVQRGPTTLRFAHAVIMSWFRSLGKMLRRSGGLYLPFGFGIHKLPDISTAGLFGRARSNIRTGLSGYVSFSRWFSKIGPVDGAFCQVSTTQGIQPLDTHDLQRLKFSRYRLERERDLRPRQLLDLWVKRTSICIKCIFLHCQRINSAELSLAEFLFDYYSSQKIIIVDVEHPNGARIIFFGDNFRGAHQY